MFKIILISRKVRLNTKLNFGYQIFKIIFYLDNRKNTRLNILIENWIEMI
jgi:hypothetical protein